MAEGENTNMVYKVCLMRDEEGKKKEKSKAIQTTRQSNTAHPTPNQHLSTHVLSHLPRV